MKNDRKELILDLLRNYSRFVTVEQLSAQLYCSSATIRRDLSELEKSGMVQRTRGGAILMESISTESPMVLRENRNEMQKQIIANLARKYVKDGMTVFMDSSSTVFTLARNLDQFNNLRIITNNLKIIWLLSERQGITIMAAGGLLNKSTLSFSGLHAVDFINKLNADACFLSAQGFTIEEGTTDAREEENAYKRCALENSREKYLLVDTSKLGKKYLYRTAKLAEYTDIITENRDLNKKLLLLK
ncbi:MAG: DeoR/GlpR family DNA-binding transcription regulator [Lachnospiraceae bacterium]|jgi:DeoR/GlpR family transcriptional regulator of sugar metabolism|nr:DeoR/GlpR family DNA-binding transcription regulator [Lachnospiraceae bacterium]